MMGGRRTIYYAHRDASGSETKIAINQNNEVSFDSAVAAIGAMAVSRHQSRYQVARAKEVTDRRAIQAGVTADTLKAQTEAAEIEAGIIKAAIEKGITIIPR
jgi:hypothetical protein